jgi:hypothetical protein
MRVQEYSRVFSFSPTGWAAIVIVERIASAEFLDTLNLVIKVAVPTPKAEGH